MDRSKPDACKSPNPSGSAYSLHIIPDADRWIDHEHGVVDAQPAAIQAFPVHNGALITTRFERMTALLVIFWPSHIRELIVLEVRRTAVTKERLWSAQLRHRLTVAPATDRICPMQFAQMKLAQKLSDFMPIRA
jgi:hypothetical protein